MTKVHKIKRLLELQFTKEVKCFSGQTDVGDVDPVPSGRGTSYYT